MEIPADAPEGLCPQCLLHGGAEAPTIAPEPVVDDTPAGLARLFPQLEVRELLGRGGMGVVYRARQRHLDRVVALKLLPRAAAEDSSFAERFGREARLLARLTHPGIIAVHDSGCVAGQYFLVMEYADGGNLRQAVRGGKLEAALVTGDWRPAARDGRLDPVVAVHILGQLCDALQYAHDQGVVHRDLKPENILLTRAGALKVADFGLAKMLGPAGPDAGLTGTGQVLGTFRYMAPEQLAAPQAVDHRSDLYALGVVFYELLTGDQPAGSFPPPSQFVPTYPGFDVVVRRALASDPAQRYQQARELREAAEAVLAAAPDTAAAAGLVGGVFRLSAFGKPDSSPGTGIGRRLQRLFGAPPSASGSSQGPAGRRASLLSAPELWAVIPCLVLIGVLFAPWIVLEPIDGSTRLVKLRSGSVTRSVSVNLMRMTVDGNSPWSVAPMGATFGAILIFLIFLTRGLRWSGLFQGLPMLIGGVIALIGSIQFLDHARDFQEHLAWPAEFVQPGDWMRVEGTPTASDPIDFRLVKFEASRQYRDSVRISAAWGPYASIAACGALIYLSVPLLRQSWIPPTSPP
jgi:hypothetical protein